jgi:hypothetical protein
MSDALLAGPDSGKTWRAREAGVPARTNDIQQKPEPVNFYIVPAGAVLKEAPAGGDRRRAGAGGDHSPALPNRTPLRQYVRANFNARLHQVF